MARGGEMITIDMQIAGMEASVLGRPSVDDESYVVSIYEAMERAAWIDVTEELPEVGKAVMAYVPTGYVRATVAVWTGREWDVQTGYYAREYVTHWRHIHLPEHLK